MCLWKTFKRVIFLRVGKEKKSERLELVHTDVWGPAQVSSLGASRYYFTCIDDATRKTWFIAFDKNPMFFILLRNGNLWLRMRQEKGLSVSDQKMEVNIATRSFIITVHTMGFVERKQFQEHD